MSLGPEFAAGQRLSYDGALCTVRYIGQVSGTAGEWLGVEWDDPSRGKHDGSHKDVRYFACRSKSPKAASFVRPTRPADQPRTFLQALHEKYAPAAAADHAQSSSAQQIVISGKVAEEIGFDKIRRQQAQLSELKIVILDGLRVSSASAPGEQPISEVCPRVVELDVSRSLVVDFGEIVGVCSQLKALRRLGLNGNRYQESLIAGLDTEQAREAFSSVKELALDETLLGWESICQISRCFQSLAILHASTNQLSRISPFGATTATQTLTTLYLEYNDFTALSDLACLGQLASLKNLHLKGNNISTIAADPSQETPVFSGTLTHVDISYNKVSSWSFVDALPDSFPGMSSLRLAHNPVYEDPGFDKSSTPAPAAGTAGSKATVTEEAYMITVARLACLQTLNFSSVTPTDRTNAEMFYLSRIGRQLASVPESREAEAAVTAQHRRYAELCELYDEPVVVRRKEVNPAFLEARLVNVAFRFCPSRNGDGVKAVEKHAQIPKTSDIYAVKGIAGRLFGHEPLKLRLIWETGEWDPVAGLDDAGDSSDEEYEDAAGAQEALGGARAARGEANAQLDSSKTGRWIKREEELRDSPRQFGFCVDGLDVSIRVEQRWKEDGSDPANGEEYSFHYIVQALDATHHTLRPVAAMQPRPDYFVVRPDTKDGRPGPIVPLIAADQLPDWMQLVGVARELDANQTVGLTNLGIVETEEDSTFEVRLHYDKIRAILSCADDASDSHSRNGKTKAKATEEERTTPTCETKIKTNEKAGSNESHAILSGHSNNAGPYVVDKIPQHGCSSDRVLSASRHNFANFVQACGNNERPLRPQMTKATLDEPRLTCPKLTSIKQDKQPVTAVCRHWCHHGTCKWGLQCRYVHRMPTTVEGLREVGLKGFPSWYLLMMSDAGSELPGLSSLDAMLRRLEDVQLSARQHTRMKQPQPYVDPRLVQGHTPAMLALDNPVSDKQKLGQIREMRHLLLRGVNPRQGQRPPRRHNDINHANLCASARVAVDAVNIRRQAERQQQTRDSMSVVPRVRAAARSRVEYGRDSGNDGEGWILPERQGGRARNDSADATNVRSPGFVTGRAGIGEEKLVDID